MVLFDPTYAMHERIAWVADSLVVHVPLEPPWRITAVDMVHKHHEGHPAVVMVCSPNNPTGNAQDPRIIGAAAELVSDELFIVDEAYIEFGGQTMADLANGFPNVVVVRTFSRRSRSPGRGSATAWLARGGRGPAPRPPPTT